MTERSLTPDAAYRGRCYGCNGWPGRWFIHRRCSERGTFEMATKKPHHGGGHRGGAVAGDCSGERATSHYVPMFALVCALRLPPQETRNDGLYSSASTVHGSYPRSSPNRPRASVTESQSRSRPYFWEDKMIATLIHDGTFSEDVTRAMGAAFELACKSLPHPCHDAAREIIAKHILEAASVGERDPAKLSEKALRADQRRGNVDARYWHRPPSPDPGLCLIACCVSRSESPADPLSRAFAFAAWNKFQNLKKFRGDPDTHSSSGRSPPRA